MNQQKTIQNYELVRPLGEGGMGEVWLARHTLMSRQAAIKCLHPQLLKNESVKARFKNEAATLAQLQHRNIVALLDYTEDHEGAYLIMEYVKGRDLSDHITEIRGPIPEPELSSLFGQILEGFEYAHAKKIVHRDIKPSNFIITADGIVKVLDFGIAKMLDDADMSLTKTGTRLGTVLYMSPEQVRGEDLDERSDIYSLGVTLFQMATGQCPYDANTTEFHVYNKIVNEELPSASSIYPGVTPAIEALIRKATAKKPTDRFQNCREFLVALRGKVNTPTTKHTIHDPVPPVVVATPSPPPRDNTTTVIAEPVGQAAPSPRPPVDGPPRKKRTPLIIGGIFLILILVAAAIFLIPQGDSKRDKMYVIASGLYMRAEPYDEAKQLDKLPFREPVEIKENVNDEWAQIKYKGRKAYLARRYLATYDEFILLDNLTSDVEGRNAISGSYHMISLRDYFRKMSFHIDLPEGDYQEVYQEEKDNSQIWRVKGFDNGSGFKAGIIAVKLEKGSFPKTQYQNSAVIIENKADSDDRRLVTFRHFKNGSSVDIGSIDLSQYPGYYMKDVKIKDLTGYQADNYREANAINADLKNGKEGLLLSNGNRFEPEYLVTWGGLNNMNLYRMSRN
jgi:serine/threonine protein kinase